MINPSETRRTVGLAMIIEVVRRRFHLVLVPFLFVMAAGLSLAIFLPSLWTAKSTILVDRQKIPESFVKSTITTDVEAQLLGLSQQQQATPEIAVGHSSQRDAGLRHHSGPFVGRE